MGIKGPSIDKAQIRAISDGAVGALTTAINLNGLGVSAERDPTSLRRATAIVADKALPHLALDHHPVPSGAQQDVASTTATPTQRRASLKV